MISGPCKDCKDRWIRDGKTCHSVCEKYLEYKANNEKLIEDRKKRNKAIRDIEASQAAARKYYDRIKRY